MKCDYCGKGKPELWNKDGKFCNEVCYRKWQREEQEKRRCKNPKHPTTFVDKDRVCVKSWKCEEYHAEGCVAK